MAKDTPAIPVNPSRAATSPITKNVRASFSMFPPPRCRNCESRARWRGFGMAWEELAEPLLQTSAEATNESDLERAHHLRADFHPGRASRRGRVLRARLVPPPSPEGHGPDPLQEVLQQGRRRGAQRRDCEGIRGLEEQVRGRRERGARGSPEGCRRRRPLDRSPG